MAARSFARVAAADLRGLGNGAVSSTGATARGAASPGLRYVYFLWFVILCDPQWWIAAHGASAARHLPTVLFALLALMILFHMPRRVWLVPLLCFTAFIIATGPFATNFAYTERPMKELVLYYVLAGGTIVFVKHPRRVIPILLLAFAGQYVWWGVHGAATGQVSWHPELANYDSFGPVMVMGLASSFYLGVAAQSRRLRWLCFGVAALSGLGLVSSFARGAFLAAVFVLAWSWIRAPKKGWATAGVLLAAAVIFVSAATFFTNANRGGDTEPNWFTEMTTLSRADDPTTNDRKVLWKAAWQVFLENPVVGVGAENFGPWASAHFKVGQVGGDYADNPLTLYDRKIHNSYFQLLAEGGVVGSLLFLWMIVDFWRRNVTLRSRPYTAVWAATTGGSLDLRWIALGLEAAMVGFLATAAFYNQLFSSWLYMLLLINALLYGVLTPRVLAARRAAV